MPQRLSSDDRRTLLVLARTSLIEVVRFNRLPEVPPFGGRVAQHAGAFVTLYYQRRLRGCVGLPRPGLPLGEVVVQAAAGAARNDPRFAPIRAGELRDIEIEISVLSDDYPIERDAIEVGRHGLLVIRGNSRGLLLPQVAAERGWSAQEFLEQTCAKAGLSPNAWQDPATRLTAFEAEVFSEEEMSPEIEKGAADGRAPSSNR
jgi:AmmeMemoRadiSam system protein A